MRALIATAALIALSGCLAEDKLGGEPAPASFVCADDRYFTVISGQQGDTASVILTFANGETALLLAEPSASGARYGWPSDGTSYVFWSKGEEATVYRKDGTQGGTETPLYTDCKLQ